MTRRIAVMGLGYVGLATSVTLVHLGHHVIGLDPDESKIQGLLNRKTPFHEEGFAEFLEQGCDSGRLMFTSDPETALSEAEFIFICVGTPSLPTGEADLSQVRSACTMIGRYARYATVINKSTVPVGTGDRVERWIKEEQLTPRTVNVVSNPEFLREGSAIRDSLDPTRIVIGAERMELCMEVGELFEGLSAPMLFYRRRTAEMVKYASNAFLATKISFINEIAAICDRVGADVNEVAEGMGYDPRIGPGFLRAGVGYGGSCFPKDTSALIQIAGNVYYDFKLLKAVVDVNTQSRLRVIQLLEDALGGLSGRKVAVLGLSFKPNTDDIRESPALTVIPALLERGAVVTATDPVALERAESWFATARVAEYTRAPNVPTSLEKVESVNTDVDPSRLTFMSDVLYSIHGADAAVLLTEWPHYTSLDWVAMRERMNGDVLVDGRNALNPREIKEAGFRYIAIGRSNESVEFSASQTVG